MTKKTRAFRNHLFGKVYDYILKVEYFNAIFQQEDGYGYDPEDFYATAVPELLRSLKDNYELDKNYRSVVGSIPQEERQAIQNFMAWFNIHQDDGFQQVYAHLAFDQSYDFGPLNQLEELTKTREFDPLENDTQSADDALEYVFRVIDRFTTAAKPVLKRRLGKKVLNLQDEYDMQDLLLVMLRAHFPIVKSEQVTEGSADRQFLKLDFLIPDSKIAIECKFHKGGNIKSLSEQLDIDIQSYHRHPDCRYLVFFIYDKDLKIIDPNGLEQTYEQKQMFGDKTMNIFLKIRPKN